MVPRPDAIDSATSQFFINVADNPTLDYKDRTPAGLRLLRVRQSHRRHGSGRHDQRRRTLRDTTTLERTPAVPVIVMSIRRIR